MRSRFWVAYGAVGLAFLLLVPAMTPLSGSMDAFASDLANGTFRPFGSGDGFGRLGVHHGSLGGLTGNSEGGYVPGMNELPERWMMDRDGRPGAVTIDYVFDPALGSMKRLKAFDRIGSDGVSLEVADTRLRPVQPDPFLNYDTVFTGHFQVMLRPGEPIPIFSPHPNAVVTRILADERIPGGLSILKDGADTFHVIGGHAGLVTVNVTYQASSDYYRFQPTPGFRADDYPAHLRPTVPPELLEDARIILARAGVPDTTDVSTILSALNAYFRGFEEGDIPPPSEVESLYLALAAGGHGCCRHRAYAYMVTAQAAGIPARVVVNEAHAFVEVAYPNGRWHQVNLGGCGTYRIHNPDDRQPLFDQAADPRGEANPDEGRAFTRVPSFTDITDSPERIQKGERYFVNGTVVGADGRNVAFARIDLFLNETKDTPGRLTGAGTTGPDGRYSVEARVPAELPARGYQLVARATDGRNGTVLYDESWSDPPVDVFSPTRLVARGVQTAVGVETPITGVLVDVDERAVANGIITWTSDGNVSGSTRTDLQGRFVARVTFTSTGVKPLTLQAPGDEHHGPSETLVRVDVREAAIILPAEPYTLARGQEGTITGMVSASGRAVADAQVHMHVPAISIVDDGQAVRTDAAGRFTFHVTPHAGSEPGAYGVTLTVPSLDLETTAPLRIAIAPTLTVNAPEAARESRAWLIEATLTSDDGTRLAGRLVELDFDGNLTTKRALLTNSTGVARFEMPENALPIGLHGLHVHFPGDLDHLNATHLATIEVSPPFYERIPLWGYAAALGGLALLGLAGYGFAPGSAGRRALVALAPRAPIRSLLHVSFPDHPAGVPPVFSPGETARVEVRATDKRGRPKAARVHLACGATQTRGRARHDAPATLVLTMPPRGPQARLVVRGVLLARMWTPAIVLHVPVSSYREAVERAFVELRERARLSPAASPDETVARLARRLPHVDLGALVTAARLFAIADYSAQPIDRGFYHEFAHARERILDALEAEPHAA